MTDTGVDVRQLFTTERLKQHLKRMEEYSKNTGIPLKQVIEQELIEALDRYEQTHNLKPPN